MYDGIRTCVEALLGETYAAGEEAEAKDEHCTVKPSRTAEAKEEGVQTKFAQDGADYWDW